MILQETTWDKIENIDDIKCVRIKTKDEFEKDGLPIVVNEDGTFRINIMPFFSERMNAYCGHTFNIRLVHKNHYKSADAESWKDKKNFGIDMFFLEDMEKGLCLSYYFRNYMLVPIVEKKYNIKQLLSGYKNSADQFKNELV